MGVFGRLFGKNEPTLPPIPEERLWVGKIVGLLMWAIRDYGVSGIDRWTVVIENDNSPALVCGLLGSSESGKRHCILGQCKALARIVDFHPSAPPFVLEVAVQDLAFEICQRAEPRWKDIVFPGHTEVGTTHVNDAPWSS